MEFSATPNISRAFYEAACAASESMPAHIFCPATNIHLGRTMTDIHPAITPEWNRVDGGYFGKLNIIGIAEYMRPEGMPWIKSPRLRPTLAHESGHAHDHRTLGDPTRKDGFFSLNIHHDFWYAWREDRQRLIRNPSLYADLDKIFQEFLIEPPSGPKETFAELWAHEHGYSTMVRRKIYDMRPLWPESSHVIRGCVQRVKDALSHTPQRLVLYAS